VQKELLNRGLYSTDNFLLHSDDSLLVNDRIFVGNQTDDFVVSTFLPNSNRVLMLGLGYGGALRALLIGNNNVQVTAVDMNPMTIKATELIMENYFPEVSNKVNYVQNDAFQFLKEYTGPSFDTICLDLYTSKGYPPIVLEDEFWLSLKKVLSKEGTVLFNSWGLPQQLSPLEGGTAQQNIAHIMCEHFSYLSALPNRRNMTFIAHRQQIPVIKQYINKDDLNDIDRLIVDFFPQRIKNAKKINCENIKMVENEVILTMDEFNDEMYRRWPNLIKNCNQALDELGFNQVTDLIELLNEPIRAKKMTKLLLDRKAVESVTIPILVGASAFNKPEGLEWYLYWMLEDGEELMDSHKEWFINTALWQLLEIAANPYANYATWAGDIEQLLKKLKLK
jgi:SAM-dependent methyltransferase